MRLSFCPVEVRLLRVKKNHECGYLRDTGTFVVQIVLLKEQEIKLCGLRPAIFQFSLEQSPAGVNPHFADLRQKSCRGGVESSLKVSGFSWYNRLKQGEGGTSVA